MIIKILFPTGNHFSNGEAEIGSIRTEEIQSVNDLNRVLNMIDDGTDYVLELENGMPHTAYEICMIFRLYDYIEHDPDDISNDFKYDYITENTGRDKKDYFWYLDETVSAAICIEDGRIVDDEEEFEALFC